jgi:hypothetical protein
VRDHSCVAGAWSADQGNAPEIMSIMNMNPIKSAPRATSRDEPIIPVTPRKTMTTLLPDDCRWPIGDPQVAGFQFCGKSKQGRPSVLRIPRAPRQHARPAALVYLPAGGRGLTAISGAEDHKPQTTVP